MALALEAAPELAWVAEVAVVGLVVALAAGLAG